MKSELVPLCAIKTLKTCFLLPLVLGLSLARSSATTLFPAKQMCPVCGETFIATRVGSYSSFGEPERDLSDQPFVRFGGAETCPYCLFSSLKADFEDVSDDERAALQSMLPTARVRLQEFERKFFLESPRDMLLRAEWFFPLLLARECNGLRKKDGKRDAQLLLHLYYDTDRHETLHGFYRTQVIALLSSLLAEGEFNGGEEAVFTYLLGELNRLGGRDEEALQCFGKAEALVQSLPKPDEENEGSFEWVEQWAFEQSCRIRFVTNSVQCLAATLNAPEQEADEPEWYFSGSEDDARILANDSRGLPPKFPCRQHEVQPGDTLSSIAKSNRTSVSRLLELNPHIKDPDKIMPSMPIWTTETDLGWPEERVMASLDRLILDGNANAISFFLEWSRMIGPQSLKKSDWHIQRCFSALASATPVWRVPPREELDANRQQVLVRACLAMLRGDADACQELLPFIESKDSIELSVVFGCLKACRSDCAKEIVMQRLNREDYDKFDMLCRDLDYLSAVAGVDDLGALKKIARTRYSTPGQRSNEHMYDLGRLEDAMLRIKLRAVIERTLEWPGETGR